MAKTYLEMQKQISKLQAEAEDLRRKEAAGVLTRIREAITVYGFTAADLGLSRKSGAAPTTKRTAPTKAKKQLARRARFEDGAGNSWGGRGPRPGWFKQALASGKTLEQLRVS